MLFSPWTTFRVSRLPAVRRGKDDTAEEFAARVAEMLAAQLGVKTTPHTYKDKVRMSRGLYLFITSYTIVKGVEI